MKTDGVDKLLLVLLSALIAISICTQIGIFKGWITPGWP
jgi:hypothetical protein